MRSRAQAYRFLPDPSGVAQFVSEDTLFDVFIGNYRKLSDRAHDVIVQHVCIEVESNLKAHLTAMMSSVTLKSRTRRLS